MKLVCTEVELSTRMFTPGKRYEITEQVNRAVTVTDDLGHSRTMVLEDGRAKFGVGHTVSDRPLYAHFLKARREVQTLWPPITDEQDATLQAYAEYYGEGWQKELLLDWMKAGSRAPVEWGHLQRLRNTHGPKWLAQEYPA